MFLFNLNLLLLALISLSVVFTLPPSIPSMAVAAYEGGTEGKFPKERIIVRGAGGKFLKHRRARRTPYDRPSNAARRRCHLALIGKEGTGCLSRLIDPASRIIARDASVLSSSVLSSSVFGERIIVRGAGGKFPKHRRARRTPYDRPSNAARRRCHLASIEKEGTGCLSRLIDPASRIIARDASVLSSSVLSSSVFGERRPG